MSNPTMSSAGEAQRRKQREESSPPSPLPNRTWDSIETPKVKPKPKAKSSPTQDINLACLESCVDQANGVMGSLEKSVRFKAHDEAGKLDVEVLRKSTREVLKTITVGEFLNLIGEFHGAISTIIHPMEA